VCDSHTRVSYVYVGNLSRCGLVLLRELFGGQSPCISQTRQSYPETPLGLLLKMPQTATANTALAFAASVRKQKHCTHPSTAACQRAPRRPATTPTCGSVGEAGSELDLLVRVADRLRACARKVSRAAPREQARQAGPTEGAKSPNLPAKAAFPYEETRPTLTLGVGVGPANL
jgi:hypothetical protein